MNETKFTNIIFSKSFDELLEGYKRSISLIKHIDRDAYKEIINCFKYLKENSPQELVNFQNLIKQYWQDKDNKLLLFELHSFNFIGEDPTQLSKNITLLPTQKLYKIAISAREDKNGLIKNFDLICTKRKMNINEVESRNDYIISPIFDEILEQLNEGKENEFCVYSKYIHNNISDWGSIKISDYTLYMAKNGQLKANVKTSYGLNHYKEILKTKNIKDNTMDKFLNHYANKR